PAKCRTLAAWAEEVGPVLNRTRSRLEEVSTSYRSSLRLLADTGVAPEHVEELRRHVSQPLTETIFLRFADAEEATSDLYALLERGDGGDKVKPQRPREAADTAVRRLKDVKERLDDVVKGLPDHADAFRLYPQLVKLERAVVEENQRLSRIEKRLAGKAPVPPNNPDDKVRVRIADVRVPDCLRPDESLLVRVDVIGHGLIGKE